MENESINSSQYIAISNDIDIQYYTEISILRTLANITPSNSAEFYKDFSSYRISFCLVVRLKSLLCFAIRLTILPFQQHNGVLSIDIRCFYTPLYGSSESAIQVNLSCIKEQYIGRYLIWVLIQQSTSKASTSIIQSFRVQYPIILVRQLTCTSKSCRSKNNLYSGDFHFK